MNGVGCKASRDSLEQAAKTPDGTTRTLRLLVAMGVISGWITLAIAAYVEVSDGLDDSSGAPPSEPSAPARTAPEPAPRVAPVAPRAVEPPPRRTQPRPRVEERPSVAPRRRRVSAEELE